MNCPVPLQNIFCKNSDIHNHNTKHRETLHTLIGNSEVTYANFSFHGIYIWNIIFESVNIYVSYSSFKHITKSYIHAHEIKYRLRT